jgi:hypothetical protein
MNKRTRSASVNKALIIREALSKGISSPSAISAYAKENKGIDIDTKYISVIKSNLRTKAKGRGARSRLSRELETKEAMMFALKNGTIDKAKKALEGVRNDPVLAFAVSMGGVDRAIAILDELATQLN